MTNAVTLTDSRFLITGATGQVGAPVAVALAATNTVVAIARFGDAETQLRLEHAGVECVVVDFEAADFTTGTAGLHGEFDYVLHFAVAKTNNFDRDITANAEVLGFLMQRCANAKAFLHCSSTAVYEPTDHHRLVETDPLGVNHRAFGFMPTYSISKIAAEAMARFGARVNNLPTTIARLSVPYGDGFGWPLFHLAMMRAGRAVPVHHNAPSEYNPIHIDDIVAQIPALLGAATVPATIVNWAGDDVVSIESWCEYLGELDGTAPTFAPTDRTIESVACDVTRRTTITGPCTVAWRDGLRRLWEATHYPARP